VLSFADEEVARHTLWSNKQRMRRGIHAVTAHYRRLERRHQLRYQQQPLHGIGTCPSTPTGARGPVDEPRLLSPHYQFPAVDRQSEANKNTGARD